MQLQPQSHQQQQPLLLNGARQQHENDTPPQQRQQQQQQQQQQQEQDLGNAQPQPAPDAVQHEPLRLQQDGHQPRQADMQQQPSEAGQQQQPVEVGMLQQQRGHSSRSQQLVRGPFGGPAGAQLRLPLQDELDMLVHEASPAGKPAFGGRLAYACCMWLRWPAPCLDELDMLVHEASSAGKAFLLHAPAACGVDGQQLAMGGDRCMTCWACTTETSCPIRRGSRET